jgi:hypothetical protein
MKGWVITHPIICRRGAVWWYNLYTEQIALCIKPYMVGLVRAKQRFTYISYNAF